ncbi:unnamed protein product [Protopolystoma xenopodis]|uniref:Uncharacterized protein n=1 Tax=Protopolystoma xenopodis TaxID=117903 RepID=A0A3S5B5C1_9PLAT|nr:unnamed protein product [Protopolystoma xenopodis]
MISQSHRHWPKQVCYSALRLWRETTAAPISRMSAQSRGAIKPPPWAIVEPVLAESALGVAGRRDLHELTVQRNRLPSSLNASVSASTCCRPVLPGETCNKRSRAPPLISRYRGETPPTPAGRPLPSGWSDFSYDGGLFRTTPASLGRHGFYVIHPEWLSDAITIRRLGPGPRPTPLPVLTTSRLVGTTSRLSRPLDASSHATTHASNSSNAVRFDSRNPNNSTSAALAESSQRSLLWPHRCKSAPPIKHKNPITWDM